MSGKFLLSIMTTNDSINVRDFLGNISLKIHEFKSSQWTDEGGIGWWWERWDENLQNGYFVCILDMIWSFFKHYHHYYLQVLLTPPEQGPRIKGQRIKLQDIIDGAYNPLTSNNGSWINCKY